jgi:hypothetical protein
MHERSLLGPRLRRLTAHPQAYGVPVIVVNAGFPGREPAYVGERPSSRHGRQEGC